MNTPNSRYLSTSEVAQAAGVGRETMRHYEEKELVVPLSRSSAGYRQYSPAAVELVVFIKETQAAGFALKEIQELLQLRLTASNTCGNVSDALNRKLVSIDDEIASMRRKRTIIESMVVSCCSTASKDLRCGIIP